MSFFGRQIHNTIQTGEVSGSITAKQLPSVACNLVRIRAQADNANDVYVGAVGVTKPNGVTDVTSGFPLAAGEETGWIPVTNLDLIYIIGTLATDDISYMAVF